VNINMITKPNKKLLLAFAVASSFAVGNAFAAAPSYTTTVKDTVDSTDADNLVIEIIDGNDTATLTAITLGDAATDSVTISSANDANTAVTLSGDVITGDGSLIVLGENDDFDTGLTVITGANIGTALAPIGAIKITSGDEANAAEYAKMTITSGHDVYADSILLTDTVTNGTLLTIGTSGADVIMNANITSAADSTGTIVIADELVLTGNIGTGVVAGTTAMKKVTINDGVTTTIDGTVNADLMVLGHSTGTGTQAVTFKNTVTLGDFDIGLNAADATNNITFDTSDQAFTATIDISDGDADDTNTINITSGDIAEGGTVNQLTYANAIAAGDAIDTINVGSATKAGKAQFSTDVAITTLNILGGNTADEDSTATFAESLATTAIVLNDATGTATLQFEIAAASDSDETVSGTINAATAGEGIININDLKADAAPELVTFSGVIGGNAKVGTINVGSATTAGSAKFSANVSTTNLKIFGGDHADEDSTVTIGDALTATAVTLDDATGSAILHFEIAAASDANETIAGTIDGAADGEGIINIDDAKAEAAPEVYTFSGIIGGTKDIGTINVGTATTSGSAVFSAAVSANNINVTGGNHANEDTHVDFAGAVTATTITLDDNLGAASIDFSGDAAQAIAGAITAAADGEGSITVTTGDDDTATFAGNIGTDSVRIGSLSVTSGNGVSAGADFDGNVYVDAMTITVHDTNGETDALFAKDLSVTNGITLNDTASDYAKLTFNGTTAQTITGNIIGAGAGEGDIVVANTSAKVTFDGQLGVGADKELNTFTMNTGTHVQFNDTVEIEGEFITGTAANSTGTITLGANFVDGTTVIAQTASTDSTGNFDNVTVTVNPSAQFTTGTVTLLDNDDDALDAADLAAFVVTDTALVDYTLALDADSQEIDITATKRTASGVAANLGINEAQTNALLSVSAALASGDATASAAMDSVLTSGGSTMISALEQINPDAVSSMGAAISSVSSMNNIISSRTGNSGVSSGDHMSGEAGWVKVFSASANQGTIDKVDGYDSSTTGIIFGYDVDNSKGSTIGYSIGYSTTDTDGKSASLSRTTTDGVQLAAYGDNGNFDWIASFASMQNDSKRTINFGGLSRTAAAKFDSSITSLKVGYEYDDMGSNGTSFIPKTDFTYTSVSNDAYTETGADNLNLKVAKSSNQYATARAGFEVSKTTLASGSSATPFMNLMVGYDVVNDRGETQATFTGGGAQFTTKAADASKVSVNFGIGYDLVSDGSTLNISANTEHREEYSNNSYDLTYKYNF